MGGSRGAARRLGAEREGGRSGGAWGLEEEEEEALPFPSSSAVDRKASSAAEQELLLRRCLWVSPLGSVGGKVSRKAITGQWA